jgi:DNA invertase Pin-like site-specific DNA recombinase
MTDAAPASPDVTPGTALAKAALYLRVSTGRQAESDLSIPDQRRQITAYCVAKGWDVAAEFVEMDAAARCERPDIADRDLLLCILWRCDDAPDRQRESVSLLHLLDQGPARRERLSRVDGADGQA